MYCRCGNDVHPVRQKLGYNTCVDCSTAKTYSYIPIIEHKQAIQFKSSAKKCLQVYTGLGDVSRLSLCVLREEMTQQV